MEAKRKWTSREDILYEGTAVRNPAPQENEEKRTPVKKKHRVRAPALHHGIDFQSLVLLLGTMAITLYLCWDYLRVQGNIVGLKRDVSILSSTYETLASENAALENSLCEITDYQKLFEYAVSELGMVFPNKNDILYYESEDAGHVIQYKDIPEK